MDRRGFLKGMAGILAAGVAPAAIGSGILMPVKKLWVPDDYLKASVWFDNRIWVLTNNGLIDLTVTGMECGDWKVKTPRPILLEPGNSITFEEDRKVFGKWEPKSCHVDFRKFGKLS